MGSLDIPQLDAVHDVTGRLFELLGTWFQVGDNWTFSLVTVDAEPVELLDSRGLAAFTMRKLQALRWLVGQLRLDPLPTECLDAFYGYSEDLQRSLSLLADRSEPPADGYELLDEGIELIGAAAVEVMLRTEQRSALVSGDQLLESAGPAPEPDQDDGAPNSEGPVDVPGTSEPACGTGMHEASDLPEPGDAG